MPVHCAGPYYIKIFLCLQTKATCELVKRVHTHTHTVVRAKERESQTRCNDPESELARLVVTRECNGQVRERVTKRWGSALALGWSEPLRG